MAQAKVVYRSKDEVVARSMYGNEFVHYASTVTIKDAGKNRVSMKLKFEGIPPFVASPPPEEHSISAPSVVELFRKLERWLKRHGYTFHYHN